jgi:endonuclease/exonuclease/phosphatase (EEP) superfamily protein YafD
MRGAAHFSAMTAPPGQLSPVTPPPGGRGPRRRLRRVLAGLTAAAFTAGCAAATLPDLAGLDTRTPFVQLVALRQWELVAEVGVLGALLVLIRFVRRARVLLVPSAAGLLVVVLVGASIVLPRLIAKPVPTTGTPLTVMAFNTFKGGADPAALAALIAAQQPDLVSLPEAGPRFAAKLGPLVEPLGYRLETSRKRGADVDTVTALVSNRMGDVSVRIGEEAKSFPYLEITGGALGALRFVAFHAAGPTPGDIGSWAADLRLLPKWCQGDTPAVVAGDFNATLDHSLMRAGMAGCSDAAAQRGDGLIPTWSPTPGTRFFGPQIDHVIATPGIQAETFAVLDSPGSDHRPIVTRLRLPDPPSP